MTMVGRSVTREKRKDSVRKILLFATVLQLTARACTTSAYQLVPKVSTWSQQLREGYQCRMAADPFFPQKSLTEVFLAAGTQFAAEWNRRGVERLIPEADFVVPAILTAVFGKYYR